MTYVDIQLRELAIRAEAERGRAHDLALLWSGLSCGQFAVAEAFFTETRWYLVLRCQAGESASRQETSRRLQILEQVLCGESSKTVAYDLLLAPSTVSLCAKQALWQMGLRCTPARVHPMLALAARAARAPSSEVLCRSATLVWAEHEYRVAGLARPDALLASNLGPAEFTVVQGLIEGKPYTEIARSRGTSVRTVANQIASAFRRLGVSGRSELVGHVGVRYSQKRGDAPMSHARGSHIGSCCRRSSGGLEHA